MATIEKRTSKDGKTHYRVKVRVKGHQPRTQTFTRLTDAREWGKATETDLKRGKFVATTKESRRTFADLVDKYLAEVLPRDVADGKRKDEIRFRAKLMWWREALGERFLVDLKPSDIAEARDRLAGTKNRYGKPLTGATINRYLAALGTVFKQAVREWHWLEQSPVPNVGRRGESKGRRRYLDDDDHQGQDERSKLLAACQASPNPDLYPAVMLAITTGMRKGEILSLRWPQIDMRHRVAQLVDTKNNDSRAVPLPPVVIDILKPRRKVRRLDDDRVFIHPTSFDQAWRKALTAAEITDFRFHDLRHTAASYLAMHGATLAELAEVLGHKTLQMVKRYSHLTEQHKRSLVDRMAAGVFGDE